MIRIAYNLYAQIYGNDAQLTKAIEELSELQKAICKYKLGEKDGKDIIEEVADVEIMTEQIKLMFNCHKQVEAIKTDKIQRMIDRVVKNSGG